MHVCKDGTEISYHHVSISSVHNWQQHIKKRITRLIEDGFIIAMTDEAFFVRDIRTGHKY